MDHEQRLATDLLYALRHLLWTMQFDLIKADIRIRGSSQHGDYRVCLNLGLDEGYDVFYGESIPDIVSQVQAKYTELRLRLLRLASDM